MQRPDEEKKPAPERDITDESLRAERRKTDAELASAQRAIKEDAEEVVAEARLKADSVLSDARDLEDERLAADGSASPAANGALDHERAREDALLTAERQDADAEAAKDRARRQLALASLLAFERSDTDLRLQIERARADEALTSREDFLAMVSHDLRSLLGSIALSAELLKKGASGTPAAADTTRHAETIQRVSARMNRLIGDLIDVASIEAGRLAVVPADNDAAVLVRDAAEAFQPAAAKHAVSLTCEIGDGVGAFSFDDQRILQVLTNLVGNALKFTAAGGQITLRVETSGGGLRFSVADTGEGIAPELVAKIFERFFQTKALDRRGLGLGLYIARSIVRAHGGDIGVESTPGQGSTFFFTLPRA